jgi:hypothetical protein
VPKLRALHSNFGLSAARDTLPPRDLAARQLGFELSVITGARIGDGQLGYGAGVLSFLEVRSFLLGFEGRVDGYRTLLDGDPETALELALLAGKRFDFHSVALDLTAGPGVAMKGIAFSHTESAAVINMNDMPLAMPSRPPPSEPGTGPVPRLLLGARLGFSPRSVFRTFVGIDGELGPARADSAVPADEHSARLPTFSLGLAIGATVGSP